MLLHSRLDWVHNSGVSASLLQRGTFIPGTTYFGGPDVRDLVLKVRPIQRTPARIAFSTWR